MTRSCLLTAPLVAAVAVLLLIASVGPGSGHGPARSGPPHPPAMPRVAPVAAVAAAAAVTPVAAVARPQPSVHLAGRLLAGWDRARAHAFAAGDVRALRSLYADRAAGAADVATLRAYVARGVRVDSLALRRSSLRLARAEAARLVLVVREQTVGGRLRLDGRAWSAPLPAGGWTTRRLVLEEHRGRWRMASAGG